MVGVLEMSDNNKYKYVSRSRARLPEKLFQMINGDLWIVETATGKKLRQVTSIRRK